MGLGLIRRLLGTILVVALAPSSALAQAYVPGEVLVKLKGAGGSQDSYAFLGKASTDKEMVLKKSWGRMNMYHFAVRKGQSVEAAIRELKKDPNVEYAEPNYIVRKAQETGVQQTFSLDEIRAEALNASSSVYLATNAAIGVTRVWQTASINPTGTRPIVAVVDTGLDTNHTVFTGTDSLWVNTDEVPDNGMDDDGNGYVDDYHGYNFVDGNGTMYDDDGHGTHVAGIILSVDQNIYSAPLHRSRIQIMPLKFLDGSGSGSTSAAIQAIHYAVQNGARILNNSWGGFSYSAALHDAVAYSYRSGALFVAAAGNSSVNTDQQPLYPASLDVPNVISVAATRDNDELASFSNYGANSVDLGSPGVYILSTLPSDTFGTASGTSMAAPFVAGTAAQMKVEQPSMNGYQLRAIVLSSITNRSVLSGKVSTSGRLDSAGAVSAAQMASVESSLPSYTVNYMSDDRSPSSVAGCGTVRALSDTDRFPPWGSTFVIAFFLFLPILLQYLLRRLSPRDLRKFERFKIDSDVRISVGDKELVGSISSISLGGAQVNTSALLQDGGLLTLSIASPDGKEKVEVVGRVVWSEANKSYGVAFDQAPPSVLSRISDWTRGLQKN